MRNWELPGLGNPGVLSPAFSHVATAGTARQAFVRSAQVTPVLSSTPRKLGEQAPTVPFDTLYERITSYVAYTPIHNVAGTPAMSVPLGWAKNGLPIGSQFAAAKGDDGLLYALAYELEQARPWAAKHGVVWAG